MKKYIIWSLVLLLFFVQIPMFSTSVAAEQYVPAAGVKMDGIRGTNGIYYGKTYISFDSGIEYSMDQGRTWKTYSNVENLQINKGYNIWYRSVGASTYNEINVVVKEDSKPPLTTSSLLSGKDGYTKDKLQIQLAAIDNESGVSRTEYSTDQGQTWLTYSGPVTVSDESQEIFSYRSIDKRGNVEKTRKFKTLIDQTPPDVPDIKIDPMQWTNNNITVSIMDGIDQNSGTLRSEYKIGYNGNWITYVNPFVISEENQSVYARSIDNAGNISSVIEAYIPIDRTAPQSPLVNMSEDWNWFPVNVAIDMSKDLEEPNDIQYEYKIGEDGQWQPFIEEFEVSTSGETPISFRSFDEAGNYSPIVDKVARFDDIPPTASTEFKVANLRYNSFDLSWSGATDNIGIKGYDIYTDDDQFITTVADAKYRVTGLEANTTYKFKVVTYDNASNESDFSEVFAVTTHSRPDFQVGDSSNMVVLRGDGTVWTWGAGRENSLGDGTNKSRDTAKQIPNLKNVKSIFNGNNVTLAQKVDGSVWGWGSYPINSATPVEIKEFNNAKQLYVKNRAIFAVQNDGRLWAWGKGTLYGSYNSELDTPQSLNVYNVKNVDIQDEHVLVLTNMGEMIVWGSASSKMLGDPKPTNTYSPFTLKLSNSRVSKVAAGKTFDLLLNDDGTMIAWGYDGQGQLGNNRNNNFTEPSRYLTFPNGVRVLKSSGLSYVAMDNIRDISIGENHALAVDKNNELWGWGSNANGLLMYDAKFKEEKGIIYQAEKLDVSNVKEIVKHTPYQSDSYFTLIITTDDKLIGWGNNQNVVLGIRSSAKIPPVIVADSVDKVSSRYGEVAYTKDDETFWMFGNATWNGKDYSSYATAVQVKFDNESVPPGQEVPIPTTDEVPQQPSNIELKEKSPTTATITWTQNEQKFKIEQYRIFVDGQQTGMSSTTTYALTGLQPEHSYSVTIEAVSDTGKVSKRSEPLIVDTPVYIPPVEKVLEQPSNLELKEKGTTTAALVWTQNEDEFKVTQYRIFVDDQQVGTSSTKTYTLTGLQPEHTYKVTIQAVSDTGKVSKPSEPLTVETAVDLPSKPANLKVKSSTFHSVDLTWDKSSSVSPIKEYIVFQDDVEIGRTASLTYSVKSLRSGTAYQYTVQSVNDAGKMSEKSETISVSLQSDIPTAPTSLSITKPVDGSATITWNTSTSQGIIQKYVVRVNDTVVTETAETKYILNSIDKSIPYTIVVTAVTDEGIASSPSQLILPAAPVNLATTDVDMYTKNVSWQMADSQKSNIKMYKVYLNGNFYKSTSDTQIELELLIPGKTYTVQVTAISNTDTESQWSDPLEVSTVASPLLKKFIFSMSGSAGWIKKNGDLWVWGTNVAGNLGDGTTISKTNAVQLNIKNVKQISIGGLLGRGVYTLAVTEDGKLWGWGTSYDHAIGDLSPTAEVPKLVTLHSQPVNDVVAVTTVPNMNYILKTDGTVWSFGAPSSDLKRVEGLTSIIQIVGEYALKSDGTVWEYSNYEVVQLKGLSDIKQITAEYGLKTDGTVWKWTFKGDTNDILLEQVPGLSQVIRVEAGNGHIVALKQNGSVWTFGSNSSGQLGIGTIDDPKLSTEHPVAVEVKGLRNVIDVSVAGASSFAIQADGKAWGWGFNYEGRLGDGTTIDRPSPVKVVENTPPTVKLLEMGESALTAKSMTNPKVTFKWEQKDNAVNTVFSHFQIQVLDEKGQKILDSGELEQDKDQTITNLASWISKQDLPRSMTLQAQVRVKDSNLWSEWSQSGWFSVVAEPSTPKVFSLTREMGWIKADGSVWMWGKNDSGQLGDGTTTNQLNAIPINIQNVKQIFNGGTYSLALKTDGSVWGWGTTTDSSLGEGLANKKMPSRVIIGGQPLKNIQQIVSLSGVNYILKNDGTVWYFGPNSDLRQVPNLTSISQLAVNSALKSDGTVWQYNTTSAQLVPTLSNVQQLLPSLILKKDGTVWTWVYDASTKKTTVTQVTGLTQVAQIQNGMAVKKDGTLWTWGENYLGQLGDGTTQYRSTPAQVKGISQVVSISIGRSVIALQADGTAWTWAENTRGQLGDGTTTNRLLPVKVLTSK